MLYNFVYSKVNKITQGTGGMATKMKLPSFILQKLNEIVNFLTNLFNIKFDEPLQSTGTNVPKIMSSNFRSQFHCTICAMTGFGGFALLIENSLQCQQSKAFIFWCGCQGAGKTKKRERGRKLK